MATIRLLCRAPCRAKFTAATSRAISTTTNSPDRPLNEITHPYFVARTASNGLPVYTDIRNAGSKYVTLIRHISGDADVSLESFPFWLLLSLSSPLSYIQRMPASLSWLLFGSHFEPSAHPQIIHASLIANSLLRHISVLGVTQGSPILPLCPGKGQVIFRVIDTASHDPDQKGTGEYTHEAYRGSRPLAERSC